MINKMTKPKLYAPGGRIPRLGQFGTKCEGGGTDLGEVGRRSDGDVLMGEYGGGLEERKLTFRDRGRR
jgi:hypothetical protein